MWISGHVSSVSSVPSLSCNIHNGARQEESTCSCPFFLQFIWPINNWGVRVIDLDVCLPARPRRRVFRRVGGCNQEKKKEITKSRLSCFLVQIFVVDALRLRLWFPKGMALLWSAFFSCLTFLGGYVQSCWISPVGIVIFVVPVSVLTLPPSNTTSSLVQFPFQMYQRSWQNRWKILQSWLLLRCKLFDTVGHPQNNWNHDSLGNNGKKLSTWSPESCWSLALSRHSEYKRRWIYPIGISNENQSAAWE